MYRALRSKYPVDFASHVASFTPWTRQEQLTVSCAMDSVIYSFQVYDEYPFDFRGSFLEWVSSHHQNFVRAANYQKEVMETVDYYFSSELYSPNRDQEDMDWFNDMVDDLELRMANILPIGWFIHYLEHYKQIYISRLREQIAEEQEQ
jgi:hypothetical protein